LETRLTSSALGITTQYTSDGQLPLTISSVGNFTTILYGLGPVAEKTDQENDILTVINSTLPGTLSFCQIMAVFDSIYALKRHEKF